MKMTHARWNRYARWLVRGGMLYSALCIVAFVLQRSLLYFPSHHTTPPRDMTPWAPDGQTIGYCREVPSPDTIWLMMHGNAGQASDRGYVLEHLPTRDSLYVLEYPGYGTRPGKPSRPSMNQAAAEAYQRLRQQFPKVPIGVIGESIGSGPASMLSQQAIPPEKIVLITPFDVLHRVAAKQFWFLPVRMLLLDRWDNIAALKNYQGKLEVYGAKSDEVIPIEHARQLAANLPRAKLIEIPGGHNDWSLVKDVTIRRDF